MPDITMEDAGRYDQLFRETLSDESYRKYCRFVDDFRHFRINVEVFVSGVMDLLKEHDGLLLDFNKFLPEMNALASHQKRSSSSSVTESVDHANDEDMRNDRDEPCKDQEISRSECDNGNDNDAVPQSVSEVRKSARGKVLRRIRNVENDNTYRGFLELRNDYREHKDVARLEKEVSKLFRDQPELHVEFTVSLVDAIQETVKELESSIEVCEDSVDEGVKVPEVIENAPHDGNLFRCEDARLTAQNMVYQGLELARRAKKKRVEAIEQEGGKSGEEECREVFSSENIDAGKLDTPPAKNTAKTHLCDITEKEDEADFLNKDVDIGWGGDIADILKKLPVSASLDLKVKVLEKWRDEFHRDSVKKIEASSVLMPNSEPPVKKPTSPELAATDEAVTENCRDESANKSPSIMINFFDEKAPDFEPALEKQKSSSSELAVAGAETEFSPGEEEDENIINTDLVLSVPASRIGAVKK